MGFKVYTIVVSQAMTNCYLAVNGEELLLIDPGDSAGRIRGQIERLGARVSAILLTHGHFDHIQAAKELSEAYGAKIYASRAELPVLQDARANLTATWMGEPMTLTPDVLLEDGQVLHLAGEEIRCILTPGHTPGGMCFYLPGEGILFSGDTLFRMSVGRTDFPGGSMQTLLQSVARLMQELPEETLVYPGHDAPTSLAFEMRNNPYVGDSDLLL